jgi:hypothetical protein
MYPRCAVFITVDEAPARDVTEDTNAAAHSSMAADNRDGVPS